MQFRPSTLLADLFSAFATFDAQRHGVTFDAGLTAQWAEALRVAVSDIRALEDGYARVTYERDQLLAIARDADLIAYAKSGAPRASFSAGDGNIIDISGILQREHHAPGGAA